MSFLDPLHGVGYLFWSGIGAGSPVLAGLVGVARARNCHVKGCWRLSRHTVGPYRCCSHHHPLVPDEITAEHIQKAHSGEETL